MKRTPSLLWPVLVGALSLGVTGWLWQHEQQTQQQALRSNFDFGLRHAATRIEQRMAGYEQMLRGARGLFEASRQVDRDGFATYVDALLTGADAAGLRSLSYVPLLSRDHVEAHVAAQRADGVPDYAVSPPPGRRERIAPVTYIAPAPLSAQHILGYDPLSDPVRREAMLQAGESGRAAITHRLTSGPVPSPEQQAAFLMFLPLYTPGPPPDSVQARRLRLAGWVAANIRVEDLMSSLYGEDTPGLEVRVHDGIAVDDSSLIYGAPAHLAPPYPARFEAQEYIAVAGRTWTLVVRSTPAFERHFSNDSARIIAVAGGGLSGVLALLAWLLVTGRERAHAAARAMTRELRESAERYRRIVETANEGIWTVDAEARTSFANPKMLQLLGYGMDELQGRCWFDLMDAAGRATMEGEGGEQLHRGLAEQHEIRFLRKDGADLWVTLSTSPIVDPAGRYAGALAMVTDVTERRQAEARRQQLEAQLRQSQKMEAIGTLAGGIAHDFNNILAAILGNVSLAEQELGVGHASLPRLQQISHAGGRARSLVQQIVAFSRQQPQARVNQPLRPLLEDTLKLLRSTLPALVELELQATELPLRIDADATQLQQVLMNLCTNAWHALHGSTGRIVIGMDAHTLDAEAAERLGLQPGPHAHLWVSDDGGGMDEATRLRVFEPFFTTKPVGQGTGLGLSVVHGIVSAHGGAITVTSTLGVGSRFEMYFPLAAPPAEPAPPPAAEPAAPRGQGQHVLYVDDDPVMLVMVEGLLQRAGYRVTCMDDPRAALARALAAEPPFDVVVTDFNMPELSGIELVQALARSRPGLPVVISSGYVSDGLRADALRAGVRQVLQKEYTLEQLASLVHQALNASHTLT